MIPIPRRLMYFLKQAKGRSYETGFVIHNNGERIKDIKKSFATAVRKAGLSDVTPHTLRHTSGTWMAQRGVPLFDIAGWLGHSHERTSELYSHHHSDYLEKARKAFD
ncbi:tyrosine-type recombinase/integrase [Sneathiella sp. HT1-7]|nr:tyrosine-type recombinase/integrase [Sneathiella sp. HT1-7]